MREVALLHLLARISQYDSKAEVPFTSLALESALVPMQTRMKIQARCGLVTMVVISFLACGT
jgi:hypothetical protein